jgi:hypothetical protein
METEQLHQQRVSRTLDAQSANGGTAQFVDNRPKQNLTGLPDNLKSGIENLSGFSMDDVRVHYNSDKPAQLQALAYTQGTDIHVAPGQEKHLPHEAWHVVQQMQGRVRPTMQLKGVNVNDEEGLEKEADRMGGEAVVQTYTMPKKSLNPIMTSGVMQRRMEVPTVWNDTYSRYLPNDAPKNQSWKSYGRRIIKLCEGSSPTGLSIIEKDNPINKVVRDKNNGHLLTKMHIINSRFGGGGSDDNLRLGTSSSNLTNTDSHYHAVEQVICNFIKNKEGDTTHAVDYGVEINGPVPEYLANRNYELHKNQQITYHMVKFFLHRWCPTSFLCNVAFYKKEFPSSTWKIGNPYLQGEEIPLDM